MKFLFLRFILPRETNTKPNKPAFPFFHSLLHLSYNSILPSLRYLSALCWQVQMRGANLVQPSLSGAQEQDGEYHSPKQTHPGQESVKAGTQIYDISLSLI